MKSFPEGIMRVTSLTRAFCHCMYTDDVVNVNDLIVLLFRKAETFENM
jgi:hypothetical protein